MKRRIRHQWPNIYDKDTEIDSVKILKNSDFFHIAES